MYSTRKIVLSDSYGLLSVNQQGENTTVSSRVLRGSKSGRGRHRCREEILCRFKSSHFCGGKVGTWEWRTDPERVSCTWNLQTTVEKLHWGDRGMTQLGELEDLHRSVWVCYRDRGRCWRVSDIVVSTVWGYCNVSEEVGVSLRRNGMRSFEFQ